MRVNNFESCKNPGDFFFVESSQENCLRLFFLCPCGCGILAGIRINHQGTQDDNCWSWNLDREKPTCQPSIMINHSHWHGYLTDGLFIEC